MSVEEFYEGMNVSEQKLEIEKACAKNCDKYLQVSGDCLRCGRRAPCRSLARLFFSSSLFFFSSLLRSSASSLTPRAELPRLRGPLQRGRRHGEKLHAPVHGLLALRGRMRRAQALCQAQVDK